MVAGGEEALGVSGAAGPPYNIGFFVSISNAMNASGVRIYHNPRCSKSRAAYALLQERGCTPEVVLYLDAPPTKTELRALLEKLQLKPLHVIRMGENIFKQHYAGRNLSDDEWLDAIVAYPILLERPIVVRGNKAVVGRPPERVLELF